MKELYTALQRPSGFYGMGLFWTWIYCAWYTPALFADSAGFTIRSNPFCEQSCVVLVITLAGMLILRRSMGWFPLHALLALSSVVLCIASLSAYLLTAYQLDSAGAIALCSLCIGVASAFMMALWVQRCCTLDIDESENIIPLSFLPTPIGVGICLALPQPANTLFMAMLPLASALLFRGARPPKPSEPNAERPPSRESNKFQSLTPVVVRVSLGALLIETLLSLLVGAVSSEGLQNWGGAQSVFVGGSFVGIAFLVFFIKYAKRPGIFAMMRIDTCLVAIAALLLALALPISDIASSIILIAGQMGLDAFLIVNFARLGHMKWKTSLVAAIISRLPLQLGVIVGNAGAALLGPIPFITSLSAAAIATLCAILASFFTSRNDDRLATAYAQYEQTTIVENQIDTAALNEPVEPPVSPFEQKCLRIADEKHLTPREADVLPYLARGMSVPFISTKLVVSRNTVDTHVRNIYRKLDIHSRDELIEYVEEQ